MDGSVPRFWERLCSTQRTVWLSTIVLLLQHVLMPSAMPMHRVPKRPIHTDLMHKSGLILVVLVEPQAVLMRRRRIQ